MIDNPSLYTLRSSGDLVTRWLSTFCKRTFDIYKKNDKALMVTTIALGITTAGLCSSRVLPLLTSSMTLDDGCNHSSAIAYSAMALVSALFSAYFFLPSKTVRDDFNPNIHCEAKEITVARSPVKNDNTNEEVHGIDMEEDLFPPGDQEIFCTTQAKKLLKYHQNSNVYQKGRFLPFHEMSMYGAAGSDYINSKLDRSSIVCTEKDQISSCAPEVHRRLHQVLREFFTAKRLKEMRSEGYDLALKFSDKTIQEIDRDSLYEYAERGIIGILKDNEGRDLITHMKDEGFSDSACLSLASMILQDSFLIGDLLNELRNRLIRNDNMEQERREIQDEIKQLLDSGMSFTDAIFESKFLRNAIFEEMRLYSDGMSLIRKKLDGSQVTIRLDEFAKNENYVGKDPDKYDLHRFDQYTSRQWTNLPFMPFGSGAHMCPGSRLAQTLLTVLPALWLFPSHAPMSINNAVESR